MTKNELLSKLIVMGFKQHSSMTYTLSENGNYARIRFHHNQHVHVNINYNTFKGSKFCTYNGALIWICKNAKQN